MMTKLERLNGYGWIIHLVYSTVVVTASAVVLFMNIEAKIVASDVKRGKELDGLRNLIRENSVADSTRALDRQNQLGQIDQRIDRLWRTAQQEHKLMMKSVGQKWETSLDNK